MTLGKQLQELTIAKAIAIANADLVTSRRQGLILAAKADYVHICWSCSWFWPGGTTLPRLTVLPLLAKPGEYDQLDERKAATSCRWVAQMQRLPSVPGQAPVC